MSGSSASSREIRSGGGRRGRNKFYVYPTPVSPTFPHGLWTELRRFVAADVQIRHQRLLGMEVLFPAALRCWGPELVEAGLASGRAPREIGEESWSRLAGILRAMEVRLQPDAVVRDCDPEYFRWTQWIFLQLHRRQLLSLALPGITGQLEGPSEPVDESPRPGPPAPLTQKSRLERWMLSVGQYGERLVNDLGKSHWSPRDKGQQRHRLGRRRGCELIFQVSHHLRMDYEELKVFTTRVECVYGATFLLIHPWHPVLEAIVEPGYEDEIQFYRDRILRNQEPRLSGVRTGGFAINPANLRRIPVLVGRLAMEPDSGGAILGVPAHDPLLFELAQRTRLPIREVVRGEGSVYDVRGKLQQAFCDDGQLTNSGPFSGVSSRAARDRIISFLARRGICRRATRYYFDWIAASEKSVWGVPVPMVHCPECGTVPVPESQLPVLPPEISLERLREARESARPADLGDVATFSRTTCPECNGRAERDSHVLASWLGEAWMFLRHPLPELAEAIEGMPGVSSLAAGERTSGGEGAAATEPRDGTRSHQALRLESLDEANLDQLALFGDEAPQDGPPQGAAPEEIASGDPEDGDRDAPDGGSRGEAPRESDGQSGTEPAEGEASPHAGARGSDPGEKPTPGDPGGEETGKPGADPSATGASTSPERLSEETSSADGQARAGSRSESRTTSAGDGTESRGSSLRERRGSSLQPFRKPAVRRWLSVDLALASSDGGVLEILHARFLTKFLYDIREVSFYEPFFRFARCGRVTLAGPTMSGEEGGAGDPAAVEAMLRSLVDEHGADAVRMLLLSTTSIAEPLCFQPREIRGVERLMRRIRRQVEMRLEHGKFVSRRILVQKHRLIDAVTRAMRRMRPHRAVSAFFEFVKSLEDPDIHPEEMDRNSIRTFLVLLSPFAPNLASELWALVGSETPLDEVPWPEASAELLQPVEVEMPVLIDNRLAHRLTVPAGLNEDQLRQHVLAEEIVAGRIGDRGVSRVVAVPGKIVNILLDRPGEA